MLVDDWACWMKEGGYSSGWKGLFGVGNIFDIAETGWTTQEVLRPMKSLLEGVQSMNGKCLFEMEATTRGGLRTRIQRYCMRPFSSFGEQKSKMNSAKRSND